MTGKIMTTFALAAFVSLPLPAGAESGADGLANDVQVQVAETTTTYTETIEHYSLRPGATIIAPSAPPPLMNEAPPPPPLGMGRYVWQPGHWNWSDGNWNWSAGSYVEPVENRSSWDPGHWSQEPEGWVWREGHWR